MDSYNVTSVPTKLVIDKKGNIRFMVTDEPSTPEGLTDELSTMINIVQDPGIAAGVANTYNSKN